MPKTVNRLTALKVQKLKKPGWYADGGGLYLQISPSGSKSWVFRYVLHSREHRHGLGSYETISLIKARQYAEECRVLKKEGIDPIQFKRAKNAETALKEAN
ncbi:MAG: Arm DNA-binding domain-containing protein, partial [Gammaproteobacteria bacterium]|nr:Arm DNA-binding domain-containing protein [Gammaproteobacteria bacterium]